MLKESSDFSEESVEKRWGKELANESGSKFIPCFDSSFVEFVQPYSEEFINVFMRIGFGSTIKLVSFDKSQVVTFNSKLVCGFKNSDYGTRSQSDNMVDSLHGFIVHWIIISKNIKKVTKVIDVKNWRVYNSWVLWWIISLIVWNSSVSLTKSSIQSTFRFRLRFNKFRIGSTNQCPLTRITPALGVSHRQILTTTVIPVIEPSAQIGNNLISRVYYVEGLGHNLFSVGQFCDSDLEVAFRKHTCFVDNLEGVDLLSGSRGSNLYTISLNDMMKSSLICMLSKFSRTKSWLWHRRLSHLNFGTINQLVKEGLVTGFPKLKYAKGHLCLACQMGKSKKESHKPKPEPSTENVATDHLSMIENNESSNDSEVNDNFPEETLMEINTRNEQWKNPTSSKYILTGIDFIGPFLKSHKFEYILVAVDYVSKWAETQALPTNDARVVITFLKKLFCLFEMPKALISDRDNPAIWPRKLDDVRWDFRTVYKTPTGTTPYKLIYGKNCHMPFEIKHRAYWALKNCNPDLIAAGEK
ncbi:retrovirus-related pol polyprotein from transposon TNT 1-94 [Tanacetum coccineum]